MYSKTTIDEQALETILEGLPTLDRSDAEDCDSPLSPEEVENAVKQLNQNKSLGLDELSAEFYTFFWSLIKYDLFAVLNESIKSHEMPRSSRRAIIFLLPKKGDLLDIKNWRPVSLLNTDYKICLLKF